MSDIESIVHVSEREDLASKFAFEVVAILKKIPFNVLGIGSTRDTVNQLQHG